MVTEPKAGSTARSLAVRLARLALGLVLLLGPVLAVELWMRSQPHWLRPVLRSYTVAMDMKLLFIEHRGACPDLVTFGTSLTDQGLPPRYIAGRTLAGVEIEDPFDFAIPKVRATSILAQYRWLRQRGCKPTWIVVEVSPAVINAEHGGPEHDPALMSARAQLGMPEGFAAVRGYTVADQLELATYDRLLIHRRRKQIAKRVLDQFEAELWFMSPAERDKAEAKIAKKRAKRAKKKSKPKLEFDGKLTGLRKSQSKSHWAREQRSRRRLLKQGHYKWGVNDTEQDAITTLTREAAAEGVVVILQSPPVTALYHSEISPALGMAADYEAFVATIEALADELPNVVWHDAYTDPRYKRADFTDWVHLSRRGSKRYVKRLIEASDLALKAEQEGQ